MKYVPSVDALIKGGIVIAVWMSIFALVPQLRFWESFQRSA